MSIHPFLASTNIQHDKLMSNAGTSESTSESSLKSEKVIQNDSDVSHPTSSSGEFRVYVHDHEYNETIVL